MKKSTFVFLLIALLFQSCVVYQNTSVSLEDAVNKGNAKVINKDGQDYRFTNIEFTDSLYYGIDEKNQAILLHPTIFVYLQDIQQSKKKSRALGLGLGLGIPVVVLLSVFIFAYATFGG